MVEFGLEGSNLESRSEQNEQQKQEKKQEKNHESRSDHKGESRGDHKDESKVDQEKSDKFEANNLESISNSKISEGEKEKVNDGIIDEDSEDESYSVLVYVYDLSRGMAKMYSPMILGIPIDAIYHTSVVVYSNEHYIDQGIKICQDPGNTKYGLPIDVLDLGETFITKEIFEEFLQELRDHEFEKYHPRNYDLFNNNCNHFTNVCLDFLVGKQLDDKILKLPEQVLSSPNGQVLKNMIGNVSL